ncbi:MAG: FtsH protease activity modulator HflK [Planctomycetota bacterium]|nr:FtsH protease activity modulator HflK [Planctomycetota bacterium]MEC9046808.1 FtsH protease activity modulator HflK [Planctomycetota bacterium]
MAKPTLSFRRQPDWSKLRALKWVVPAVAVLILALTTYYTVPPDSQGVVLRFGRFSSIEEPGLHFKIPFGVDSVETVPVKRQLKLEFGFGTPGATNNRQSSGSRQSRELEKSMVTGDLSAASIEWIVQYRIDDPRSFLFVVRAPEQTLRDLSEAVMREVIGDRTVDEVITTGRQEIEDNALLRLREMTKDYQLGIKVDQLQLKNVNPPIQVQDSFNEVNKAQQDRQQKINVANGEYNKVVPKAKGLAEQTISEAEGYKLKRINEAQGDAAAFTSVLTEYVKAPEVTRKRLYLETMTRVIPGLSGTWIVDDSVTQLLPMVQGKGLGGGK